MNVLQDPKYASEATYSNKEYFFNCYLAGPRPTLGHFQGTASLTGF